MELPPFLIEKAAGIEIEDALPAAESRKLGCRAIAAFCGLYRRIAICRLLSTGNPHDFLYFRFLMTHFGLRSDAKETLPLLERYEALAAGNDPRADVCRALFARDQERFD